MVVKKLLLFDGRFPLEKELSAVERSELDAAFDKAQKALEIVEGYDQQTVDRLCQAVAWSVANKKTFLELVDMGIEESQLGDPVSRQGKRFKILGCLRDALRQKSIGIIEEIPEKGIVKYGKPVGIIASLVPTTNPTLTPAGQAIYAIKARDAVIFSPHPRSAKTTNQTVALMREALEKCGAPADLLQCLTSPTKEQTGELMQRASLVIATGGRAMVHVAYSSGTPAYGSGAGNATMIFDETTDVEVACHNSMLSKTSDYGSGCSADGNLIVCETIYDQVLQGLQDEGGYLANDQERDQLRKVMWDEKGHRLSGTVAIKPQKLAEIAGFSIPEDRKFIFVIGDGVGKDHPFCSEKLTTLMTVFKYSGEFENALTMMKAIYDVGGKGHSVGIYSHDDDHINRLALVAPVSRIMVRQPQSKANAGSFTNGMPMTSSMGCGTWGGNIVSENICLKHYMNTTWVSRPIPEDRPTYQELFGEFYDPALEE
ncbi:MAG: aldehyde dehydrogenase family protein [Anaerolineaceae bacterium]|jgi:sulfoacetaldehyde dehydrogenase|nr:aldehyde dehydrogenase family protein [Anaerolineaceae bacterium]